MKNLIRLNLMRWIAVLQTISTLTLKTYATFEASFCYADYLLPSNEIIFYYFIDKLVNG
jgi:hypothetical protein